MRKRFRPPAGFTVDGDKHSTSPTEKEAIQNLNAIGSRESPHPKAVSYGVEVPSMLAAKLVPERPFPRADIIDRWKETADFSIVPDEPEILGRLYNACLTCLKLFLKSSLNGNVFTESQNAVLEHQYQIFRLWGDDLGAGQGRVDRKLRHSQHIFKVTLGTLKSIGEVLAHRLARYLTKRAGDQGRDSCTTTHNLLLAVEEAQHALSEQVDADEDDGGDDDDKASSCGSSEEEFPTDSVEEVLEDIKSGTRSLLDLIPSIEWPAEDSEDKEAPLILSDAVDRSPQEYYSDLIRARFPNAPASLIERFGFASWQRYQRGQAERERNSQKVHVHVTGPESVCDRSDFDDSGIGSSIPSDVKSVHSSFSSRADSSRARLPPIPEEAKMGVPFSCDACGKQVRITKERDWRKHLYHDLEPYMCFFEECSTRNNFFVNRELFTDHIILEHGFTAGEGDKKCPLCTETLAPGRGAISGHVARHMEEISLYSLPRGTESEADSDATLSDSSDDFSIQSEEEITRCVCGFEECPDENRSSSATEPLYIQCDICKAWQHGDCVGILSEEHCPDEYFCEECKPQLHSLSFVHGRMTSRYLSLNPQAGPYARFFDVPLTRPLSVNTNLDVDARTQKRQTQEPIKLEYTSSQDREHNFPGKGIFPSRGRPPTLIGNRAILAVTPSDRDDVGSSVVADVGAKPNGPSAYDLMFR